VITPPITHLHPTDFEEWWTVYPRRTKKRAAWDAYQAAIGYLIATQSLTDAQAHDWLVSTTRDYANSPAGREPGPNGDFRPGADSWLKTHRFEDDQSQWQQPNGSPTESKPRAKPIEQRKGGLP
jgi:hypothetical protein